MSYVVLGGGGVLGTGFREVLHRRRAPHVWWHPDWSRPESLLQDLVPHLHRHLASEQDATLIWAAGIGGVGASAQVMEAETTTLRLVAAHAARLPPAAASRLTIVFASSAGAVYAGHGASPVDADTAPAPTSAYGTVKLDQEAILRRLAHDHDVRVLACRYSNVYGLASGRLTARGLVSVAVRATRYRQPMTVYVRPDNRRDYVYAADAAGRALELVEAAPRGYSQALVCDGGVRTVAGVLSLVGHVSGRRVPVAYAERPATRLQPPVLRFARGLGLRDTGRATAMETAVHRMMRAPVA